MVNSESSPNTDMLTTWILNICWEWYLIFVSHVEYTGSNTISQDLKTGTKSKIFSDMQLTEIKKLQSWFFSPNISFPEWKLDFNPVYLKQYTCYHSAK